MVENKSYRERILSSTKVAISQLLVKLKETLDEDLADTKLKLVISGRLELIVAVRKMIVNLSETNKANDWITEKLPEFKDGIDATFDVLESLLSKDIEEDDASKYASIAKSKIEASNFMYEIIDSLKEIEKKIEKGETSLEESAFKSSIEQFARD